MFFNSLIYWFIGSFSQLCLDSFMSFHWYSLMHLATSTHHCFCSYRPLISYTCVSSSTLPPCHGQALPRSVCHRIQEHTLLLYQYHFAKFQSSTHLNLAAVHLGSATRPLPKAHGHLLAIKEDVFPLRRRDGIRETWHRTPGAMRAELLMAGEWIVVDY